MTKAVIMYSTMNPPTVGHNIFVQKLINESIKTNSVPLIFLLQPDDSLKTLSFSTRYQLAAESYGSLVVKSSVTNIVEHLKSLSNTFDSVTVFVAPERVSLFEQAVSTLAPKHSINIALSDTRDPDIPNVTVLNRISRKHKRALKREAEEIFRKEQEKLKEEEDARRRRIIGEG